MNVNIVDFKAQPVALLTHQGAANTLMNTAAQFIEWRKEFEIDMRFDPNHLNRPGAVLFSELFADAVAEQLAEGN